MPRLHQLVFVASLLSLSWLGMMAIHELGHVLGALFTCGNIERVVLHPLAISRTDVSPNPNPAVVVWTGPVFGCALPWIVSLLIPARARLIRNVAVFFAEFCLLANGTYIAVGSFDRVGDCREMLRTGSPFWMLPTFGVQTIPLGIILWHRLGSVRQFFSDPAHVPTRAAYALLFVLILVVAIEIACSPT